MAEYPTSHQRGRNTQVWIKNREHDQVQQGGIRDLQLHGPRIVRYRFEVITGRVQEGRRPRLGQDQERGSPALLKYRHAGLHGLTASPRSTRYESGRQIPRYGQHGLGPILQQGGRYANAVLGPTWKMSGPGIQVSCSVLELDGVGDTLLGP